MKQPTEARGRIAARYPFPAHAPRVGLEPRGAQLSHPPGHQRQRERQASGEKGRAQLGGGGLVVVGDQVRYCLPPPLRFTSRRRGRQPLMAGRGMARGGGWVSQEGRRGAAGPVAGLAGLGSLQPSQPGFYSHPPSRVHSLTRGPDTKLGTLPF